MKLGLYYLVVSANIKNHISALVTLVNVNTDFPNVRNPRLYPSRYFCYLRYEKVVLPKSAKIKRMRKNRTATGNKDGNT